jgi:hypothetical protein
MLKFVTYWSQEYFFMKSLMLATIVSAVTVVGVPGIQAQVPIRELQKNRGITVSGVIRSVVGNDFVLDDGTGQIIVDAGPRWYHQLNFTPGERVTVVGEYDGDELDAFTITRSNGDVMQIREPFGPPPWSGSRRRFR